jgi:hypothetical protein
MEQRFQERLELVRAGACIRRRAATRDQGARPEQAERHVGVADVESEEHARDDTRRRTRSLRYHPTDSSFLGALETIVTNPPAAKFFVNHGVVSSRTDMLHLLRPLLKQTVTYRYLRGREVVSHGTGWVERIVVDADESSTYFTPLAISLNIDSFEHLEFETRPDQLLVYALVQGDERVVVEFAPVGPGAEDNSPFAPTQLAFEMRDYVQMELSGLEAKDEE